MSTIVLTDAVVTVNGTDLSDHVQQVAVTLSRETGDDTAMSFTARTSSPGLKAAAIAVTFLQDFAASEVDATLWSLYDAGTEHNVVVKERSAATSATNPTYTLTGFISSYAPIGGQVGGQHTTPVQWVNSGSSGVARATS